MYAVRPQQPLVLRRSCEPICSCIPEQHNNSILQSLLIVTAETCRPTHNELKYTKHNFMQQKYPTVNVCAEISAVGKTYIFFFFCKQLDH